MNVFGTGREKQAERNLEPSPGPMANAALERPASDEQDLFGALAEVSKGLADSVVDLSGALSRLVEVASRTLGDAAVLSILEDDGGWRVTASYDTDPVVRARIRDVLEEHPSIVTGLAAHADAIRRSRSVLVQDKALASAAATMPPAARTAMVDLGMHSALICPLRVQGKVIGTLSLWRHGDEAARTDLEQSFAQELADRAALAIENARIVESLRVEIEDHERNENSLRVAADLLQNADEKRKALVEHLVAAQEEERRRIAVDVHDDSIQAMAAIGLRLQILRRHAPDREFAARVSEIEDTVTESIGRLRSLLFRLESASLEKEGLAHAVGRCIADLFPDGAPRGRVVNRLKSEPPGYVQVVLFRVAQEALTNVRKHARAAEVAVVLSQDDDGTLLVVQDDGLGFDAEELAKHALPGHLGMRGMEQRAEAAGGWLKIESKPGKGTALSCWLPPMESVDAQRTALRDHQRPDGQSGLGIIPRRNAIATASSLE